MSNYGNFHNIESATRASSGNIGGSKSISGKKREVTFSSTFLGNNVGYVTTSTRTDMSQGVIRASGRSTDFSFTGENGFAVVKRNPNDPRSESVFTRSCSFREDKDRNLVNQSGYHLMGWGLDAQGNPPRDHALLDSLTTINLRNVKDSSRATTEMYISANLSADKNQPKLKGAGQLFKIDKSGLNANIKDTDVIIPEKALNQGDSFIINSGNKLPRTFVYGGISISKKIDEAGGIYGKTGIGQQFDIGAGANQIQLDTGLSITCGGKTISLKAKNGNANISEYEFTSLDSLSQAINKIDGLKASIKDKRLLISNDGNESVVFGNYGAGSTMKETLGLVDILPEARANTFRFSTLKGFKDKINANHETFGLEASFITGGLDIHSRVATEGFNMKGTSMGVTRFERATIGDGTEKGIATVTIDSPKHGLSKGDFVRISAGIDAQLPEGIYMVTNNDYDRFTISLIDDNPANFPVAGFLLVNGDFTWQKVAGEKFPVHTPNAIAIQAGGERLTFAAAHGCVQHDVVYISGAGKGNIGLGNATIPDGYYIVNAIGGGGTTLDITPAAVGAAVLAEQVIVPGNIRVQKVGTTAGAGFVPAGANDIGNFNTRVMETFPAALGFPESIRLFVPNNTYAERDYFSMAGLPADGLVIDHMRIKNDVKYQIIGRDNDWIEFTITDPADMAVGGAVGGANFVYGDPAAPLIPIDFRINHYAKTCDYLGMQQNKEAFDATYSSGDQTLSLSSGTHAVDRVISQPMKVVDSLGVEHELMINFAKLDNNRWAVEIQAKKNLDGGFDAITQNRNDGFIKAGILEFGPSGIFTGSGGLENIDITWNNGSDTNHVNINWAQVADNLNGQSSTGISQTGDYNDIRADGDGYKSGALTSVEIDAAGYIIGAFSNGQNRKLYKIPVATFDNINGLEAGADGTYRATKDSGTYRLKFAGEQGVPNITSESIEDSNVDVTEALLDLNDIGKYSNANFSALRMQNEAADKAINNLTR